MSKALIVLASVILTGFLTLFFFLTPELFIREINALQQTAVITTGPSGGNFITGYRFSNVSITGTEGKKMLAFDEVVVDLHLLPLFLGRIGIDIHSKEITAALSAGFDGSLKGEVSFRDVPIDTEAFISPENISFTAQVSGRVILSGRKSDIEIRADAITWRRLIVAGFELPQDFFDNGKGGISAEQGRVIVKSIAFEGNKGYARLSGEIISKKQDLLLELFPKDWNDFMLTPFERYKISPGQYTIPLNF